MAHDPDSSSPRPKPASRTRHNGTELNSRAGRLDDSALLHGCRAGDGESWHELVKRYERLVFSVAMRNGLDREDAADVTQITFEALLNALGRLRDEEQLPYWLMTVARRQAWRVRNRQDRETPASWNQERPNEADAIGQLENHIDLCLALDHLGSPCNDLLVALYFDPSSPSYGRIAQNMGRAAGGLGPLRARCLQRMRILLSESP